MEAKLSEDRKAIQMDVEIRKAIQPALDAMQDIEVAVSDFEQLTYDASDLREAADIFKSAVQNVEKVLKNPCATFQLRASSNKAEMYGFLRLEERTNGFEIYRIHNGDAVSRQYVIPEGYLSEYLKDGCEVWEDEPLYGP